MSWLKEVIGKEKCVISMLHLQAMPGDPGYDKEKGMKWVVEKAKEDLDALQEGGVDCDSGIHGKDYRGIKTLYINSIWSQRPLGS